MAQFMPVTIFARERERRLGGGLPKEAYVIVTGRHFLTDGQCVAPVDKGVQTRP